MRGSLSGVRARIDRLAAQLSHSLSDGCGFVRKTSNRFTFAGTTCSRTVKAT
jgi:hypothetical protein